MRLYIDLDDNTVIEAPGVRSQVRTITGKRGTGMPLQVQFGRVSQDTGAWEPELLADGSELTFGIKEKGHYDADFLASTNVFTVPGSADGFYEGVCSLNTVELNTRLASPDGNENNDVASETFMAEFSWRLLPAELPDASSTLDAVVQNKVVNGDEPAPTPGPFLMRNVMLVKGNGETFNYPPEEDTDLARGTAVTDAKSAAAAGETIFLGPSTYDARDLAKDGVDYHLTNALVKFTGDALGGIFDDSATGADDPIVMRILGSGRFVQDVDTSSTGNAPVILLTRSDSDLRLVCETISNTGVTDASCFCIEQVRGNLSLECDKIIDESPSNGIAVWWGNGETDIRANRIVQGSASGGGYTVYCGVDDSPEGQFYLRANAITSEKAAANAVIGMVGTETTARAWIDALQIDCQSTATGARAIANIGNGLLYVHAQKVFGQIYNAGSGELYVQSDKIEARTTDALFDLGGFKSFIEIGLAVKANAGNIATVSAGTHVIRNMRFTGGATTGGISLSGGTLILENCYINTAANSGTNPITKSGGTLILKNTTLVAEATRDSISAPTAQNVVAYASYANKAVDGDVTLTITGGLTVDADVV